MRKCSTQFADELTQRAQSSSGVPVGERSQRFWFASQSAMMLALLTVVLTIPLLILGEAFEVASGELGRKVLPVLCVCVVVIVVALFVTNDKHWLANLRWQISAQEGVNIELAAEYSNQMGALLRIARTIGSGARSDEVLAGIASACLEHFECEQASVMLLNQATNKLEVRHAAGHANVDEMLQVRVDLGRGLSGWVAERNRPLVLGNNVDIRHPADLESRKTLSAAMIVPICVRNRVVGVLNVGTTQRGIVYREPDLSALLVFAENAGVCIRQTEQMEWLQTRITTTESMRARPAASQQTMSDP